MADPHIIRVLVVDDHPLMRSGITGEINGQPDMKIVAEAGDGNEAIAAFRAHRPDITLMDIRMPNVGGIEAILEIRKDFPKARFVILTTAAGDIQALRAFQAGAAGYLLKNLLRTELIDTIRLVHGGRRRIPPEVAQQLAEHAADDAITPR
jgi:DNA-binding NarL/FixJ family response regulator